MSDLLTPRQREVLLLVANGNGRERIARWLGIEKSGVDATLRRVYRVLGVSSQPQAVAVGLRAGELRLEDIREPVGVNGPGGPAKTAVCPSGATGADSGPESSSTPEKTLRAIQATSGPNNLREGRP